MTKTSTKIIFGLYDLSAQKDAIIEPFPLQDFSNVDNFANNKGESRKVAALEKNQVLLDGSFQSFPRSGMNFGLWSKEMSGEDKQFKTPVILSITFDEDVHSSIGLTLHFDNKLDDMPGKTEIRWYDENDSLLDFKFFIPDKTPYFFSNSVSGYKHIEFIFYETSKPYRYLKINGIEYGIVTTKEGDEIISATVQEKCNPTCATLDISTLSCEFRSQDTDFSMLSAKGIYEYLQERQKIEVTEIRESEYKEKEEIPMGTYYVDSWDDGTSESVRLYAIDSIGVIDKTEFAGGMYEEVPAGDIVAEIMLSAQMPYEMDSELSAKLLSGYIPICSHREALQQVCIAVGGMVDATRQTALRILQIPTQAEYYIPVSRKFLSQKPTVSPLTTGVEVIAHTFVKKNEVTEIVNQEYELGTHSVNFSSPMHSLNVLGAAIITSSVNAITFEVGEETSNVLITGSTYEDIQQPIFVELRKRITAAPGIKKVENATLISTNNAHEVAVRMLDYYNNRHIITSKMIMDYEKVGSIAVMENVEDHSLRGYIESLNIDLAKGFIGEIVLRGTPVPVSYGYYTTEIYTGEEVGII